jgi:hypothetical protein
MNRSQRAPAPVAESPTRSRRALLLEVAGVALIIAVPVATVYVTAQPIPNPPNRRVMNIEPAERRVVEETQNDLQRERRKATKKQDRKMATQKQDEGGRSKRQK